MNIYKAITEGTKILKSKYILTAHLDAEILMAKVIDKSRDYISLNYSKKIDNKDLNLFQNLIELRSNRKPIAQITNKKFFWNSEFFVTKDTLIPRPDSELLVENILNLTKNKRKLHI